VDAARFQPSALSRNLFAKCKEVTDKRFIHPEYNTIPSLTFAYYTYWSGLEVEGIHFYFFEDARGILVFPTHWGQTCVAVGGERDGFHEFRKGARDNYMAIIDRVPELAEQVRAGKQEQRLQGTADQPNYFRKPYGPGSATLDTTATSSRASALTMHSATQSCWRRLPTRRFRNRDRRMRRCQTTKPPATT
jgi:hypothetical protein